MRLSVMVRHTLGLILPNVCNVAGGPPFLLRTIDLGAPSLRQAQGRLFRALCERVGRAVHAAGLRTFNFADPG